MTAYLVYYIFVQFLSLSHSLLLFTKTLLPLAPKDLSVEKYLNAMGLYFSPTAIT